MENNTVQKIAVITDVNAGLDYIGYDPEIPTLRSIINFGDKHFIDGTEIRAEEFYKKIATEDVIPSTSAPTVGEAMELMEKLISEGYTDVIMYSISFQLSSIGQMVETLKSEYQGEINIHVFDTRSATITQGYFALEAKRMAKEGASVNEILEYSNYLRDNNHIFFVVDDLKYLVKNGRLSGAAGFVGSLLKIKPVLELTKDGRIISMEKVKTHRKAMERTIELLTNEIKDAKKVKLYVLHTCREEDAIKLAEHMQSTCSNLVDVEIQIVTPAVGAHIGTGVIGMGYFILEK